MPEPKQLPSWEQYGYHAMSEMERFAVILEALDEKIDRIEAAQSEAKGSAKTWGTVAGFAVVALVEAVKAAASALFGHK